jgi:hypothetical protein
MATINNINAQLLNSIPSCLFNKINSYQNGLTIDEWKKCKEKHKKEMKEIHCEMFDKCYCGISDHYTPSSAHCIFIYGLDEIDCEFLFTICIGCLYNITEHSALYEMYDVIQKIYDKDDDEIFEIIESFDDFINKLKVMIDSECTDLYLFTSF